MVTLYEIHSTCVYEHVSWIEWLKLNVRERAELVAHYRIEKLIEIHYALKRKAEAERLTWQH